MRVLVTGATGCLGGTVLGRLARLGLPAIGRGRDPIRLTVLRDERLEMLGWDMTGPPPDAKAMTGITAIMRCAALSSPFGRRARFMAANVGGTRAVLNLAKAKRVLRWSPQIPFAEGLPRSVAP